jgi:hypothetical protein
MGTTHSNQLTIPSRDKHGSLSSLGGLRANSALLQANFLPYFACDMRRVCTLIDQPDCTTLRDLLKYDPVLSSPGYHYFLRQVVALAYTRLAKKLIAAHGTFIVTEALRMTNHVDAANKLYKSGGLKALVASAILLTKVVPIRAELDGILKDAFRSIYGRHSDAVAYAAAADAADAYFTKLGHDYMPYFDPRNYATRKGPRNDIIHHGRTLFRNHFLVYLGTDITAHKPLLKLLLCSTLFHRAIHLIYFLLRDRPDFFIKLIGYGLRLNHLMMRREERDRERELERERERELELELEFAYMGVADQAAKAAKAVTTAWSTQTDKAKAAWSLRSANAAETNAVRNAAAAETNAVRNAAAAEADAVRNAAAAEADAAAKRASVAANAAAAREHAEVVAVVRSYIAAVGRHYYADIVAFLLEALSTIDLYQLPPPKEAPCDEIEYQRIKPVPNTAFLALVDNFDKILQTAIQRIPTVEIAEFAELAFAGKARAFVAADANTPENIQIKQNFQTLMRGFGGDFTD